MLCTPHSSNLHGWCGVVWYRILRVNGVKRPMIAAHPPRCIFRCTQTIKQKDFFLKKDKESKQERKRHRKKGIKIKKKESDRQRKKERK